MAGTGAGRPGDPPPDDTMQGAVARLERGRAILLTGELDLVPMALSRLPDQDLVRRYAKAAQLVRELQ
jgi:hypothetical protein